MTYKQQNRIFLVGIAFLLLAFLPGKTAYSLTVGSKFPIATTPMRELSISVAFDGTNYLVGIQGDAIAYYNVGAQLVSQSGTLVGPLISTGRTGGTPVVAFDGTNYLLVWTDDANHPNDDIYGQLISSSGSLLGSPFPITKASGRQEIGGIAFDGTNYLIVWEDFRNDADYDQQCDSGEGTCADIYGQFISPTGTLIGSEFPISTQIEEQRCPAIAFDGINYLVVWESRRSGPEFWDIYGRFITKAGVLSNSFIISETPSRSFNPIGIAFDGINYLVVWNKDIGLGYPNPTIWDIYGRVVSPSGSFSGSEFSITTATGDQALAFLAFDGTNYLVTWTDARNDTNDNWVCDPGEGTCADIYGQLISKSGTLVGSEFVINNDAGDQIGFVAGFNAGKYLVIVNTATTLDTTWELLGSDVYGLFIRILPPIFVDFDGDGKTDVSGFHLPSDQFFTDYAGNLGQFGWGGSDSMPLIWDYDGDGKTDVSIYHIPTNQWFVKGVGNLGQFGWGGDESVPVPGDYNGDGRMERAFYHSPTNRWFVEGQVPVTFGWNGAECIPLPGDYDGDGKTDMVIYHIPSNQWFQYGVGNLGQFGWGGADCIPVPGDYNGDGVTEIAVYHVPTNQWFVKGMGNLGQYGWGGLESFPIPGDYNGDGVMERGFYRPSENRWFIEGETDFVWGWGGSDFMPITSSIAVYNWFRFILGRFQ
jgi:hypothetical protein